jgi:hypothetical protein
MPRDNPQHDVLVLSTITTFINLQSGEKRLVELYDDICDEIYRCNHQVIVASEVKKIFRQADVTASAIELDDKRDEKTKELYDEAMKFIEENGDTRTKKRQLTAERQSIIDKYKTIHTHTRSQQSLARLALHRAAHGMKQRSEIKTQESKDEAKRMKELERKVKEDERDKERKRKADEKKEKAEKKQKEREDREAKAQETTRALNTALHKSLRERNINTWKKRKEDADNRAEATKEILLFIREVRAKRNISTSAEEKKGEEDEVEWDSKENQMPL